MGRCTIERELECVVRPLAVIDELGSVFLIIVVYAVAIINLRHIVNWNGTPRLIHEGLLEEPQVLAAESAHSLEA